MAQIIVRNIDEHIKKQLQKRAKIRGVSMEEEARNILKNAVSESSDMPIGERLREEFKDIGFDEPIEELKGKSITEMDFGA